MSLRQYLKKSNDQSVSDQRALRGAAECKEALQTQHDELKQKGRKRKSSERHHYDQATKTAIGKYAQIHSNKRAVQKFSASLGFPVSEATVSNFKGEVQKLLSDGQALENIELPERKRGRPLLLPEDIDQLTKKFIQSLRLCGSPVSSSIVVAAAKGILTH